MSDVRIRAGRGRGRGFGVVAAVVALSMVAVGCSSNDDSREPSQEPSTDRGAAVVVLLDSTIIPAYERAAGTADEFKRSVDGFCASPDAAGLTAARDGLVEAWSAWAETDSLAIGPAMERRSVSVVSYRVDTAKVDALLASSPPLDARTVRNNTGSSVRGFGAAAHLLLGPPDAPVDVASFDSARCGYLSAVVAVIADELATVSNEWTVPVDGKAPYRETATGSGEGALTPTDVIDSLVNMQMSHLEAESKGLTAVAEGSTSPAELPPADLFRLDAQIRGMVGVYKSFDRLLEKSLRTRLDAEFTALTESLADDGADIFVVPSIDHVKTLAPAVENLRLTISTEVVSALDVTVGFSENDGDS